MATMHDIKGTNIDYFKIGVKGPVLNNDSNSVIEVRNPANDAYANLKSEDVIINGLSGNIITTESVETGIEELDARLYNWQSTAFSPTGFADGTTATITNTGREVTISPTGANFVIYIAGKKYTKTAVSTTIPDTKGTHYIYFDSSGNLQNSMSMWNIVSANALAAIVQWNGTNLAKQNEKHGMIRDLSWHQWAHDTIGTRYESGLVGTIATASTSFTSGIVHDEDLEIPISAQSGSCVRLWYHDTGAATMTFDVSGAATCAKIVAGVLKYDNAGTLTSVTNNKYVVNWIYGTNDVDFPIYCVVCQTEYNSLLDARAGGLPNLVDLPSKEMKLLYSTIWQNSSGTPTYIEKADYRTSGTLPGGGTIATNAGSVIFIPYGTIASTNVQSAIQELSDEKVAKAGDTMTGALVSTLAIGTAPIQVTSTTKCTNLNVDRVDDYHASITNVVSTLAVRGATNKEITAGYFISDVAIGTAPIQVTSTTKCSNLYADKADTIQDQSTGTAFKMWKGTTAAYTAIETKDDNTLYITKDTSPNRIMFYLGTYPLSIDEALI